MQYALVNLIKSLPQKGLQGTCISCGGPVIAKCGMLNVHHWAHLNRKECDSWSEPETEWHRNWKNQFPESYWEVYFTDAVLDEVHRADIHTKSGITIEFQNSPISTDEFSQRNNFYKRLIWVVNGIHFINTFALAYSLPNPESPLLKDYVFAAGNFLNFFRKEEAEEHGLFELLSLRNPELSHIQTSDIYKFFKWKNPRKVWLNSSKYVFIDFGSDDLYWLKKRHQQTAGFWYVQIVPKTTFIEKYKNS